MSIMSNTDKFPLSLAEVLGLAGVSSFSYTVLTSLSIAKHDALFSALLIFILLFGFMLASRLWNAREHQFRLVISDHGEAADSPVKEANHVIQTTHFTGIQPYEPYIALMKNKLAEGVKVRRLVARDPMERSDKYKWLNTFANCPNYTEISIDDSFPLPMDIMIFDHKTVVLHLPSGLDDDDFHSAISIDNEKIATLFENVFKRMEIRAMQAAKQSSRNLSLLK
jgi:hypothetical protein